MSDSIQSTNQDENIQFIREKNEKFFSFYGIPLNRQINTKEAYGTCPFCGKENKFSVNLDKCMWHCFVCGVGSEKGGGNDLTFIRELHTHSMKQTTIDDYEEFRKDRKLLNKSTLKEWNICKLATNGNWIVPGYGIDGKIKILYKYMFSRMHDKMVLIIPKGYKHQLFGMNHFKENKSNIYLCEGIWDTLALWEIMNITRKKDKDSDELAPSITKNNTLITSSNIIGVAGCNIFNEDWLDLFVDKNVSILYDSDHPVKTASTYTLPAGYSGMKKVSRMMIDHKETPKDIKIIYWGEKGYDPTKKSGYDIRDVLSQKNEIKERICLLQKQILSKISDIPKEWLKDVVLGEKKTTVNPLECTSYTKLIEAWKKALVWTPGLEKALCAMLAVAISTKSQGDQLWIKVIGPPSSGKTKLCEAISGSRHIVAQSNLRGFISGFIGKDDTDHSLIVKLNGKTLAVKDGDTLIQSPNVGQILAEARDIYDGDTRSNYRNSIDREYNNIKMTWILCGTSSLRQLDSSELGERFLSVVTMEEIPIDLEKQILIRAAMDSQRNTRTQVNTKSADSYYDINMRTARGLTAGYLNYLRQFIPNEKMERCGLLLNKLNDTNKDLSYLSDCANLAIFVALMRSRPSIKQHEKVERELGARLTSQLVKMANCMCVVMNKDKIDKEVMKYIKEIAIDTAQGKTLEIVQLLLKKNQLSSEEIYVTLNIVEDKKVNILSFLKRIKVIQLTKKTFKYGGSLGFWSLTDTMRKVYEDAYSI